MTDPANIETWRNVSITEAAALLTVTSISHAPDYGIGTEHGTSPASLSEAITACERASGLFVVTHNGDAKIVAENARYGSATFYLDIVGKKRNPWVDNDTHYSA